MYVYIFTLCYDNFNFCIFDVFQVSGEKLGVAAIEKRGLSLDHKRNIQREWTVARLVQEEDIAAYSIDLESVQYLN